MAFAALENFIGWALDVLEREKPLPPKLWTWIKERDDEHWLKTPSWASDSTRSLGSSPGGR